MHHCTAGETHGSDRGFHADAPGILSCLTEVVTDAKGRTPRAISHHRSAASKRTILRIDRIP